MAEAQERVNQFIDAFNRMDIDGAADMLAEDVVYFLSGMSGITAFEWEVFNTAENGNTVLNEREDRFYAGKELALAVRVMGVFKVVDDKIVEWRDYFDLAELQAQQQG